MSYGLTTTLVAIFKIYLAKTTALKEFGGDSFCWQSLLLMYMQQITNSANKNCLLQTL